MPAGVSRVPPKRTIAWVHSDWLPAPRARARATRAARQRAGSCRPGAVGAEVSVANGTPSTWNSTLATPTLSTAWRGSDRARQGRRTPGLDDGHPRRLGVGGRTLIVTAPPHCCRATAVVGGTRAQHVHARGRRCPPHRIGAVVSAHRSPCCSRRTPPWRWCRRCPWPWR